jgi:glycosyltransferase involved in cell wall biosynthesis
LFRSADIFVLPSLSESFPRVLWEAMAAHTPIVATDVGDVGVLLQAASAGLVVAPQSSRALAAAIARVIDEQDLRRGLILAGGKLVRRHTVEQQALRFWDILHGELERVPGAS